MRCPTLVLCALGLILACHESPVPAVEEAGGDPVVEPGPLALTFAWPTGRWLVVENKHEKGRDTELVYRVDVGPAGDDLIVEYRDLHFTAMSGYELGNPAMTFVVQAAEREVAAMQLGFLVSAQGQFVGLLDLDTILRGYAGLTSAEKAEELRTMLENPQMRAMVEVGAAKPWHAWVEIWLELDLEPGEVLEADVDIEFAGAPLQQHFRFTHLGPDPDRPGHVRLRCEMRIDDPRAWAAFANLAAGMVEASDPQKLEKLRDAMDEASTQLEFSHERLNEVSLDPHTMVPAWARAEERTRIHGTEPGVIEPIDTVETREWTLQPIDLACARVWPLSGCASQP